jgi:hypothetical protein
MASKKMPHKGKGHIYELLTWISGSVVKKNDKLCSTFKIKDITTGREITRRVTMIQLDNPILFINSLEGHENIKVCVEPNQHGRIVNDGSNHYRLDPIDI